jgi:hypothetical protein
VSSTLEVPVRSLIQRQEALSKANFIRSFRKTLKMDLKAGRAILHDYILAPPEPVHTMKLFDLILAAPKLGRVKTNRLLVQCRISPSKTLGGLSERQRAEVVSMLRRR